MERKLERKHNRTIKRLTAIAIIFAMVLTAAISGQSAPVYGSDDPGSETDAYSYVTGTDGLTIVLAAAVPLASIPVELESERAGRSFGALVAGGTLIALGTASLIALLFLLWKWRKDEEDEEATPLFLDGVRFIKTTPYMPAA